ncbi:NAD(P)-binding domain-containing protein [uncultured Aquimarina sp.]|uniref:NAD(P)-binding domain-containing protein n=1 Tax=uncultured Aquimarina sp. TaxID=575652 RepID=UPI00262FA5D1|nr:NAD(P)-binding domain-containing protein [uncultured Aquimarina sp.]
MKIGIIGSGDIGDTLGRLFTRCMHKVMFTCQDHDSSQSFINVDKTRTQLYGTLEETINYADVHLLAVPFLEIPDLAKQIKNYAHGKVLIDPTIPCSKGEDLLKQEGYTINQSNEYIQSLFPNSYIAKAFYSCPYELFESKSFRVIEERKLTIPFTCRNPEVKQILENLITHLGFLPVFNDQPYSIRLVKDVLKLSPKGRTI